MRDEIIIARDQHLLRGGGKAVKGSFLKENKIFGARRWET